MSLPTSRDLSHSYRDLRSTAVPDKRLRARKYKYFNFDVVKPGQLGVPHYKVTDAGSLWPNPPPADLTDLPIVPMTRKAFYKEAQQTAKITRHRHHRCPDKKSKDSKRQASRHETIAWKKAQDLSTQGISHDFIDLQPQGILDRYERSWLEEEMEYEPFCLSYSCSLWWSGEGLDNFSICDGCDPGWGDTYRKEEENFGLEHLFDSGSRLIDDALEKRDAIVRNKLEELGWIDVTAEVVPSWDMDWPVWPSEERTESEEEFELI
jgi:hypothetical protein